jgi:AraC-like DNA-binding protein
MLRVNHLLRSSGISVLRLDHPPETHHRDSEEEVCATYAANFVDAGKFGLGAEQKSWTLSPGYVFLSRPGTVHRYTHHERAPSDVCLSVIYSGSFVQEINRADDFVPTGTPTAIPPSNRLAFIRLRLTQLATDGYSLALEDWACELLSAIRDTSENGRRLYRHAQLRWYAERVEAVRQCFERRYAETHSLTSISRSVGMSPFQFARVFSELAGLPPHRYLLKVRLDRSAKMLLDGKPVTETCVDVGFSNLSHFTRSFHRRFGCLPSAVKCGRNREALGRLSY